MGTSTAGSRLVAEEHGHARPTGTNFRHTVSPVDTVNPMQAKCGGDSYIKHLGSPVIFLLTRLSSPTSPPPIPTVVLHETPYPTVGDKPNRALSHPR